MMLVFEGALTEYALGLYKPCALRAAVEDMRAQSGPALTRLGFEFDDEQLLALWPSGVPRM